MKWITNCAVNESAKVQTELSFGWKNRSIIEGLPKETNQYTSRELSNMGMVGLYDRIDDYI